MEREQKARRWLARQQVLVALGLIVLAMVSLHLIFIGSANAQSTSTFEVSPQEVKLPSKDGAVAIAILRNSSTTDPLQNSR